MSRTLETIFRHPLRLVLMLLLFPLVGLAIGYVLPRTYTSTASLWANHRYGIISTTGIESNQNDTEAGTQATALIELLQSREFALSVANATDLPKTMTQTGTALNDALVTEIAKVQVEAKENNLYTISYSNSNPKLAQQVVQAVVNKFGSKSQTLSVADAQRRITADQAQLSQLQSTANTTAQAAQDYRTQHANLSDADLQNDSQYLLLKAQADQASKNLQNTQTEITTLTQEINAQGTKPDDLFTVQDPANFPDRSDSALKMLLIGGGAGLAIALLGITIYLVVALRRDRAVYSIQDLQKITTLPVALQIPQLDKPTLSLLIAKATASPRLPYANRNS